MLKIENWYFVSLTDLVVMGKLIGEPERALGRQFQTGGIIDVDIKTRTVTTRSGQTYKLGSPDKTWMTTLPMVH